MSPVLDELHRALDVVHDALAHIADPSTRNNAEGWLDVARGHVDTLSAPAETPGSPEASYVTGSSEDPARGGTSQSEPVPAAEEIPTPEPIDPTPAPTPPPFVPGSSEDPSRGGEPVPGPVPSAGETPIGPAPIPPPPG